MLAVLLFSIGIFLQLLEARDDDYERSTESLISIFLLSMTLSLAVVGVTSLLLSFMHARWLAIWMLGGAYLAFRVFMVKKDSSVIDSILWGFNDLKREFREFNSKDRYGSRLIYFLTIFLFIVSIGPINHPDAADYHVGYAYQMWKNNQLAQDGGLTQGLVGWADYANYSFFQEGSTWLIRSSQALGIAPLVSFLICRKTNWLLIASVLVAPVVTQWFTIGKPLFLTDACIAVAFLIWQRYKSIFSLKMLALSLILGVSFKLTSAIIAVPIICIAFASEFKRGRVAQAMYSCMTSRVVIFSAFLLVLLLASRQILTGNFLYPLFAGIFTPDDWQAINFEAMLSSPQSYPSGFPLSLIIPSNVGTAGLTLGPLCGLSIVVCLLSNYDASKSRESWLQRLYGLLMGLFLIMFGPPRADYFLVPIIIVITGNLCVYSGSSNTLRKLHYFLLALGRRLLLPLQLVVISAVGLISISHSLMAYIDFDSAMRRYAWGYSKSEVISEYANIPYVDMSGRNMRLYARKSYIDVDRFRNCLGLGNSEKENRFNECAQINGVKSIVVRSHEREMTGLSSCVTHNVIKTSRNPWNRRDVTIDICDI